MLKKLFLCGEVIHLAIGYSHRILNLADWACLMMRRIPKYCYIKVSWEWLHWWSLKCDNCVVLSENFRVESIEKQLRRKAGNQTPGWWKREKTRKVKLGSWDIRTKRGTGGIENEKKNLISNLFYIMQGILGAISREYIGRYKWLLLEIGSDKERNRSFSNIIRKARVIRTWDFSLNTLSYINVPTSNCVYIY